MKKVFALLAGLVSAVAGQSASAGGFGSYGYGSYGSSYANYGSSGYSSGYGSSGYSAYGSSGYSSYAAYGSSGYSAGYGSSGYSVGYGSSGYSTGYGSSGYSAGYGSSGYSVAARPRRLFGHHHHRRAAYANYGSSGYGSSGYSTGYGSSGYSSGYGSSGYSTGYGSSGYSSGYGSSGYSTGYGSSGYSSSYGSSGGGSSGGSTYYGASTTRGYTGSTYGVAGSPPYPAPAGYHWEQRGTTTTAVANSTVVRGSADAPPYPAPAGYHWEKRGASVAGTADRSYGAVPYSNSSAPPYPAPAGYHWEQRGTAPVAPINKDDGASIDGVNSLRLVNSSTELKSDEIQLTVNVSESARIFVNGNPTTSTGESRQFVSRGLDPNQDYRFEIRVEDTVDGEEVVDSKTLVLSPGHGEIVSFDLRKSNSPVETVLTLNVPADAKVVLAGNETKTAGQARTYRTKDLKLGQVWDDYTVVVTSNGVTKEKTIRLIAGDDLELTFSFDQTEDRVALR